MGMARLGASGNCGQAFTLAADERLRETRIRFREVERVVAAGLRRAEQAAGVRQCWRIRFTNSLRKWT
jgi:hypothetical protein